MTRGISPESREARKAGSKDYLRSVALGYIRQNRDRGATADEICAAFHLGHNSIAPRLTELKAQGLVVELYDARGKRVRRLTRQGCAAGVVIAIESRFSNERVLDGPHAREHISNVRTFPEFGSLAPESYGVD